MHRRPRHPPEPFLREVRLRRESVEDFGQYPYSIPAIRTLDTIRLDPKITFFVGENGSGKSTLLEAIAIEAGFNPEGGNKNTRFSYHATESELHTKLQLVRSPVRERGGFFLRSEGMFNLSTKSTEYLWEPLHEKSHGEALLWLANNKLPDAGLYIFDEPESALSPQRQLAMLAVIHRLLASGSQFLIATHSPILMAYPDALIYRLDEDGLDEVAYEETEHYQVTRLFLQDPGRMLATVLAAEEE